MKTYVLTLSKTFPAGHPRAGQPTNFAEKVRKGEKIHTIRGNFDLWKKRAQEINAGRAVLSVREWSGKPYQSQQTEIRQFNKIGIQIVNENVVLDYSFDGSYNTVDSEIVAQNDGLEESDFLKWFKSGVIDFACIHFTDFRYNPDNTLVLEYSESQGGFHYNLFDHGTAKQGWEIIAENVINERCRAFVSFVEKKYKGINWLDMDRDRKKKPTTAEVLKLWETFNTLKP